MKHTSGKLEATRGNARAQEVRVARQREMIDAATEARHPLDDLQARLLVMEQSLLSMKRFLAILERYLEISLGIHRAQRPMRLGPKQRNPDPTPRAESNPGSDTDPDLGRGRGQVDTP